MIFEPSSRRSHPGKSPPNSRFQWPSPFSQTKSSRRHGVGPRTSIPTWSTSTRPRRAGTSPPGKSRRFLRVNSARHLSHCDSLSTAAAMGWRYSRSHSVSRAPSCLIRATSCRRPDSVVVGGSNPHIVLFIDTNRRRSEELGGPNAGAL